MLNVAIRSDWILIDQSTLTWVTFKCIIAVIAYKVVKYCISNRTLTRELFASLGENWSFRLFCSRTSNTKTDSVVMWYGTGKHRFYLYDCTQLLNRKATSSSVNSVSWLIDMSFLENVSLERMIPQTVSRSQQASMLFLHLFHSGLSTCSAPEPERPDWRERSHKVQGVWVQNKTCFWYGFSVTYITE